VIFCGCCDTFHIAFGTVAFNQIESAYLSLMSVFDSYYQDYRGRVQSQKRCIKVETPYAGFNLLFSIEELEEFKEILNQAYLLFEADRIINS
ncbi:MAG: DUF6686 family protein, partial [Bacteroidota bacterium]